jgi:hypothetical protein
MPHTRSTCPIPNCHLCRSETFSDENKAAVRAISGEPKPRKPIRRWFDAKDVRPKLKLPEPRKAEPPQPVQQYQVSEDHDQGFEPRWRAEPVSYVGRGIVYLFDTEAEAISWKNRKNAEAEKCK